MGVNVANWTPSITSADHHGQSGGTENEWAFHLHFGSLGIDEILPMDSATSKALITAYVNANAAVFTSTFNDWLSANGSPTAYAQRAAFRAAMIDWLP